MQIHTLPPLHHWQPYPASRIPTTTAIPSANPPPSPNTTSPKLTTTEHPLKFKKIIKNNVTDKFLFWPGWAAVVLLHVLAGVGCQQGAVRAGVSPRIDLLSKQRAKLLTPSRLCCPLKHKVKTTIVFFRFPLSSANDQSVVTLFVGYLVWYLQIMLSLWTQIVNTCTPEFRTFVLYTHVSDSARGMCLLHLLTSKTKCCVCLKSI